MESEIASAAAVLSYQHPLLVERLQKKEGYNEADAQAAFKDMLRFLYLCGSSSEIYGPTEKIDTAWHHFILFTRDYREFCQQFFGRFIEHRPMSGLAPPNLTENTVARARAVFGDNLSSNWEIKNSECNNVCEGGDGDQCSKCSGTTND